MNRIVRLTESDLVRIVKRVIQEEVIDNTGSQYYTKVEGPFKDVGYRGSGTVYIMKLEKTLCRYSKTPSEFYNRIGSVDGKTSECNDCTKLMYKNRIETRKDAEITEVTEKICKDCNTLLLIDNFSKKTDSVDGYNCICKSCISKKVKQKGEMVKETPETKLCNKCNKDLPITCFWNCKSNNDGKNNRCSDCCKEKRKSNT